MVVWIDDKMEILVCRRKRGDILVCLMEGLLFIDVIKIEDMMFVMSYMMILEDLVLRYCLNVVIGKGFDMFEMFWKDKMNIKKYIDLWFI